MPEWLFISRYRQDSFCISRAKQSFTTSLAVVLSSTLSGCHSITTRFLSISRDAALRRTAPCILISHRYFKERCAVNSFRECRFCGVGGKYKGRYTVEQVLISGHSQYRDATAVCQLVRPAIWAVLQFNSQVTGPRTRPLFAPPIHLCSPRQSFKYLKEKAGLFFCIQLPSDKVQRAYARAFAVTLSKNKMIPEVTLYWSPESTS